MNKHNSPDVPSLQANTIPTMIKKHATNFRVFNVFDFLFMEGKPLIFKILLTLIMMWMDDYSRH